MKRKLTIYFLAISLMAVAGALWQSYQAAGLEDKLAQIDRQTQAQRLLDLSLPRIRAELTRLLSREREKLGIDPPIGSANYPMPAGGRADFNCGFFLLTPATVQAPIGEEGFASLLASAPLLTNTIRRKACNPSAPVLDPLESAGFNPDKQVPVFNIYTLQDTDFDKPMRRTGEPGPFFAWNYKDNIVYMRSIPTTHGAAADGFMIDAAKLAEHLLPLVEPGLPDAHIDIIAPGEQPNLYPLPLVLRAGNSVKLPDTQERRRALRGPVISTWIISILSVIIVFSLLAFYARVERRRADFTAAVTHELRTPLTSFQLYTDMLNSGTLPVHKEKEYHEILRKEALRLGHLVENVLSYARMTRGKVRGRPDVGSCGELLFPILKKIQEYLQHAGFNVSISFDKRLGLLRLRTDLISVEQILINLADNAVKYAHTAATPSVYLQALQVHRMLVLRMSDNGPGVASDARRHLFAPFSRSPREHDSKKPGIGLGLALSRDMARSVGGDLTLERSGPGGCTFRLNLPLGE